MEPPAKTDPFQKVVIDGTHDDTSVCFARRKPHRPITGQARRTRLVLSQTSTGQNINKFPSNSITSDNHFQPPTSLGLGHHGCEGMSPQSLCMGVFFFLIPWDLGGFGT